MHSAAKGLVTGEFDDDNSVVDEDEDEPQVISNDDDSGDDVVDVYDTTMSGGRIERQEARSFRIYNDNIHYERVSHKEWENTMCDLELDYDLRIGAQIRKLWKYKCDQREEQYKELLQEPLYVWQGIAKQKVPPEPQLAYYLVRPFLRLRSLEIVSEMTKAFWPGMQGCNMLLKVHARAPMLFNAYFFGYLQPDKFDNVNVSQFKVIMNSCAIKNCMIKKKTNSYAKKNKKQIPSAKITAGIEKNQIPMR